MEIYDTRCKIVDSQWEFAVCMTLGTQIRALWQSRRVGGGGRWEGGFGRRGHGYTYGWFLFMHDRKPQNSVKPLSFNLEKIKFKEKKSHLFQCKIIYFSLLICRETDSEMERLFKK